MPWSNQNGGGGGGPWGGDKKKGNDNKTPWGQKPFGSGGGSPAGGPDFDDILRKGQQTIKKAGGGLIGFAVLLILVIAWLFQCFYTVKPYQGAVELFLGQPKDKIISQGLHFHFWPLERVLIVDRSQKQMDIGQGEEGFMLSSDQNIVNVRFAVRYNVDNPTAYLFNLEEPDETLKKVSESAMREVVGRRPADDIYRKNLLGIAQDVQTIIQQTLDTYKSGIKLAEGTSVTIVDAGPPVQVKQAFNAVQNANQERERLVYAGNQYKAKRLGEANGKAARILADAQAYKGRIVQEALGQTQRFDAVYSEAANAEDITKTRIYIETIARFLQSGNKLVIDPSAGAGMVPYLPINELLKANGAVAKPTSPNSALSIMSTSGSK